MSELEDRTGSGRTRADQRIGIRDVRELPTFTVRRSDMALIAAAFDGRALPIARSLYIALVEISTSAGVEVTRQTVADTAGVTKKALADYEPQFEALGLAKAVPQKDDKGKDLPTLLLLTDPPAMGSTLPGGSTPGVPPSSSSTPTGGEEKEVGTPAVYPKLPDDVEADVVALLKGKRRIDGKLVTEDEMRKAGAALAAFNAAQGADHGLGANLSKLVGRIRERPSWDAAKFVRLVESAWRLKWWENSGSGRRPTPAVVFGNANVFEQVAMDAKREAAGEAIADTPERRGRFARSVEPE